MYLVNMGFKVPLGQESGSSPGMGPAEVRSTAAALCLCRDASRMGIERSHPRYGADTSRG